ncbi:conserved hypothetical protein [Ricinus communis]|uniref:Uncharacterized protein n=1 Tax=Ricinus communis TaxID=3988 RepID=B9SRW1_RICCO|nr:conserved hypothetical protein [Ricinus communis]
MPCLHSSKSLLMFHKKKGGLLTAIDGQHQPRKAQDNTLWAMDQEGIITPYPASRSNCPFSLKKASQHNIVKDFLVYNESLSANQSTYLVKKKKEQEHQAWPMF